MTRFEEQLQKQQRRDVAFYVASAVVFTCVGVVIGLLISAVLS
ncbi:hypothetical protein [Stenotrophomonas panacihumi]|nr:hypothetical protein [Stenotrophomonas panacihumi]